MGFEEEVASKFPATYWHAQNPSYKSVSATLQGRVSVSPEKALKRLKDSLVGEQFCTSIMGHLKKVPTLLTYEQLVSAFYADMAGIYAGVRPKGSVTNTKTGSVYFLLAKVDGLAVGLRFYVVTWSDPLNTVGSGAYTGTSWVAWRMRVMSVDAASKMGIEERSKGVVLPEYEEGQPGSILEELEEVVQSIAQKIKACEEVDIKEPTKAKKKVKSRLKGREE